MVKKSAALKQNHWASLEAQPKPAGKPPSALPSISKQKSPYSRYLEVRFPDDAKSETVESKKEDLREIFRDALRSNQPLPREMQFYLACAFEELCAGFSPELLTPKRRRGKRRPIERALQADAIRYLRWCADGHIADKSPIKTVANSYKVSEKAVRDWKKAWATMPTPEIFEEFGADAVTGFMRASGTQYKRFVSKKPNSKNRDSEL